MAKRYYCSRKPKTVANMTCQELRSLVSKSCRRKR